MSYDAEDSDETEPLHMITATREMGECLTNIGQGGTVAVDVLRDNYQELDLVGIRVGTIESDIAEAVYEIIREDGTNIIGLLFAPAVALQLAGKLIEAADHAMGKISTDHLTEDDSTEANEGVSAEDEDDA